MQVDRIAPLLIAIKNDLAAIRFKLEEKAGRVQAAGRRASKTRGRRRKGAEAERK